MNVLEIPTTVAETMLLAQIPRDRSTAPVSRDSLEMDTNASARFINIYLFVIRPGQISGFL